MSDTNHKCMHPYGQCERMETLDVTPNGFNIVLDKDDPTLCHVLQCNPVKPRYRYNHKTGKLDEIFFINTNAVIILGCMNVDGTYNSFALPFDSPYLEIYRDREPILPNLLYP